MRLATFNVQNMRLRQVDGLPHLQGAQDRGEAEEAPDPALDDIDRRLTAAVIAAIDADVVALQEVFDRDTLDFFHDRLLLPVGCAPYPHRVCLPGNDGQGLNVALLSRPAPDRVTSHADETAASLGIPDPTGAVAEGPLFRRDCLEIVLGGLTLFICHFKAPWPDPERARAIRHAEAAGVRRLIETRFSDPAAAAWVVAGDLNRPAGGREGADSSLAPLTQGFAVDLMERLPPGEDWTFRVHDSRARCRPDAILISPALGERLPRLRPCVFRAGMDRASGDAAGGAFASVGDATRDRPHASDHAAVWVDLPEP
jgi:endonuclease/exonuclease/phosphatase family metal-dependent hydrolase